MCIFCVHQHDCSSNLVVSFFFVLLTVQPTGPPGIQVRDPTGVRLLNNSGDATRLLFGPTDDCTIGVSDDGLTIKDVNGVVITHANPDGKRRLLFGNPTCRLEGK